MENAKVSISHQTPWAILSIRKEKNSDRQKKILNYYIQCDIDLGWHWNGCIDSDMDKIWPQSGKENLFESKTTSYLLLVTYRGRHWVKIILIPHLIPTVCEMACYGHFLSNSWNSNDH